MTTMRIPNRITDKIALLRQAATQYEQLLQEKNTEFNRGLSAKLTSQADRLEQMVRTVSSLNQQLAPLRHAEQRRFSQLERLVRHFYAAHKRRSERDPQGVALKTLFELDGTAIGKARTNPAKLIELTQQIIRGESLATSQGHAPSTNPSVSELESLLTGASESNQEVDALTRQLKDRKNMRARMNKQTTLLIRELLSTLRLAFHIHPPATRRELMRTFGFKATYTSTEEKPDDTNPDGEKPGKTN